MRKLPLRVLLTMALLYLAGCGAMATLQRSFLYYPQPATPSTLGQSEKLPILDAEVLVTVRPRPGNRAVIYFGGNAESVATRLPILAEAFPDRALYLLNYRGYGGSSGKPSEAALQSDALVLFDWVFLKSPDVVVIGRSLGSGIAIRVASLRPVSRVVLVTPYDSIEALAERQFPYLPVRLLLVDKYESWRYAPDVHAPTLVLLAEHDSVVPRSSSDQLLTHFPANVVTRVVIPDTDHNSIAATARYLDALRTLESARAD